MKQNFSDKDFKKFKKLLNIKENPSENDLFLIEKTKKYVKFIKWIPLLRMIWIWNSVSMNASNKSSDIDLFIVCEENSIWFVRIIITFIFQILWVRKTWKKHEKRFCLSFFSTTKWMDFSSFALENDIYLYFWTLYLKPILDYNNTYENFIKTNSSWADFSDYQYIINENKKYITYKNYSPSRGRLGGGIIFLNNIFKKIFLPKTLKHYEKLWKPFWIIINDDLLKFHDNDKRKDIMKEVTHP